MKIYTCPIKSEYQSERARATHVNAVDILEPDKTKDYLLAFLYLFFSQIKDLRDGWLNSILNILKTDRRTIDHQFDAFWSLRYVGTGNRNRAYAHELIKLAQNIILLPLSQNRGHETYMQIQE